MAQPEQPTQPGQPTKPTQRRGAMRTDADRKTVMISSTVRDLPEHRKEAMDDCLSLGMFPEMMEHLPANDDEAVSASLKLVNEADIYLGIFAYHYGYIPEGSDISLTEMEYNHAVERGIPRCIFIMDKTHRIIAEDVDTENMAKLQTLKARLQKENIVKYFTSPADLGKLIIISLSQYREPDLTAFHYVSNIPAPPEPYIAHRYTLLQTSNLIGRQAELNLLTDWVTRPQSEVYWARILNIVAIGGMGKSALTWKWFNDIAPHEMQPLAGRFWWSFYYESDASFENFVIRALAYVSQRPIEEIKQIPPLDRENQLLAILNQQPYLFVLDGLERILIAYARMDAARLLDDDLDQQAANYVVGALGLPESAAQSSIGKHQLRKTADPRVGNFLRKLVNVRSSRILVSTRLYPADLQTATGTEFPGSRAFFLQGLSDDDALNLWRASSVSGSREKLLPLFRSFDSHPLVIQALAGEVAHDRHAPGNFDLWQKAHPNFNPFSLPLVQVKSHILAFALQGLDEYARKVLHTIAAFRTPADYDTLVDLLVGDDKPYKAENELIATLTNLEDRGLLGWDRRSNRYDLHPLVRGVIWSEVDEQTRKGVYEALIIHFAALPMIDDWQEVNSLNDLASTIELYNALIGLERYDDAFNIYMERLSSALFYRLGTSSQDIELLEMLFPDGIDQLPHLSRPRSQSFVLDALALGLAQNGQPGTAIAFHRRSNDVDEKEGNQASVSIGLSNLSDVLRLTGALYDSEVATRHALVLARQLRDEEQELISLYCLGVTLAAQGDQPSSKQALDRSLKLAMQGSEYEPYAYQAMRALWFGEYMEAQDWASKAIAYNQQQRYERGVILSIRLQGEATLGLDNLPTADERLHYALTRARSINLVEEELPALVALAQIRRRQRNLKGAREFLDDVWEAAERGPYRLLHADAFNVLAAIERDAGDREKAVEAATKAYRLAWCDGPPFAYHWGLQKARGLLRELGAEEPVLPPFDAAKFEPMPEVEIEPPEDEHE